MKTAVSIPDSIFDQAQKVAARLGISRSELYTRAVRNFVTRHDASSITGSYNRAYADNSGLDPVLAEMQFASIDPQ